MTVSAPARRGLARADVEPLASPWRREWFGLLLEAGLDPALTDPRSRDGWAGEPLLTSAARRGFAEIVELLLAAGASADRRVKATGRTALHAAAMGGYPEIVAALLAHGADAGRPDRQGRSPAALVPLDQPELRARLLAAMAPEVLSAADAARPAAYASRAEPPADGWRAEAASELAGEPGRCDLEVRDSLSQVLRARALSSRPAPLTMGASP